MTDPARAILTHMADGLAAGKVDLDWLTALRPMVLALADRAVKAEQRADELERRAMDERGERERVEEQEQQS